MSSISTLPAGMVNLTNQVVNNLRVVSYAGTNQYRWDTVCNRCGTSATETHIRLVSGSARCKNLACSLDRLEPTKISKYEQWLNAPDPEKQPVTAPVPVVKPIEQGNEDYQRYRRKAVIAWGYTSGDGRLIEYADWQRLPEFAREKMMEKIK